MKNRFAFSPVPYLFVKKMALSLCVATTAIALVGCGGSDIKTDASYKDKTREEFYKHGSLASEGGGFSLLGGNKKDKGANPMGVNAFLWRAALDTVSFMPIASADPFGGLITTDWYSAPETPNERAKLNIFILDRELRADGVKVTVFRQTRGKGGDWADAAVTSATASQLEEAILTRARQLKLAKREEK